MTSQEFDRARLFIFTDIRREISLGRASESDAGKTALSSICVPSGGGNFLAALGLLCYTEFAGKLKYKCKKADGTRTSIFCSMILDPLTRRSATARTIFTTSFVVGSPTSIM
jgi:hypothetical protein